MATRPILATLHRKVNGSGATQELWKRHYSRITRAIPRAVEIALLTGQPGDVVEFSSNDFGYQIATVRLSVGGKIDIKFDKDLVT